MSLAAVRIEHSDADRIFHHLRHGSHASRGHANMHLREACTRGKIRDLRYLHVMRLLDDSNGERIEGAISGPGIYWRYQLDRTQLAVLADKAPDQERERIQKRFLLEIMHRIAQEQEGTTFPPRRTRGQFYLRRHHIGSMPTHPSCVEATSLGVLDPQFVQALAGWGFVLWRA